jgi:hypothetical protein
MREQDIRRILKDVCDNLDRHAAKAGSVAVGVAFAFSLGCSSSQQQAMYMAQFDGATDSSETEADATTSDAGTDSTAQADSAMDSPSMKYMVPFPDADAGVDTFNPFPADCPNCGPSADSTPDAQPLPVYMAR